MKETALPRCIATEMCWKRWIVSSGSSAVTEMRLPMSSMASLAYWFQELAVSTATGMKTFFAVRSAYLSVSEFAALLAADPAWAEVASKCKSAKVSGMVTSHAMCFPLDHGSNVTPLLLLSSSLCGIAENDNAAHCDRCYPPRVIRLYVCHTRAPCVWTVTHDAIRFKFRW